MMHETDWVIHKNGSYVFRTKVRYGFEGRPPSFSMTHTTERRPARGGRWSFYTAGIAGQETLRQFPNLAPLARWHIASTEGPLHYIANAVYWWEIATHRAPQSSGGPDPARAFSRTVVLGALPGELTEARVLDEGPPGRPRIVLRVRRVPPREHLATSVDVKKFLLGRLPHLLNVMKEDMQRAGVLVPR